MSFSILLVIWSGPGAPLGLHDDKADSISVLVILGTEDVSLCVRSGGLGSVIIRYNTLKQGQELYYDHLFMVS